MTVSSAALSHFLCFGFLSVTFGRGIDGLIKEPTNSAIFASFINCKLNQNACETNILM